MVRGLYTAATGAIVAQANVDVIANNLANINTSGFKRTLMQVQSSPAAALFRDQVEPGKVPGNKTQGVPSRTGVGYLGFGARIYDTPAVFEQGPIQETGNSMDVALSGPGFFAVRDASGAVRYTRGGSFTQNANNELVTTEGDAVMGSDGKPITLQTQGSVSVDLRGNVNSNGQAAGQLAVVAIKIDPRGTVSSNGVPTGRLAVVEFGNLADVRPQGNDKFVNSGAAPVPAQRTVVLQGAQEKSNANVISSMVDLIANERWFDVNQKMMQTQDTELSAAISSVGKTT